MSTYPLVKVKRFLLFKSLMTAFPNGVQLCKFASFNLRATDFKNMLKSSLSITW